MNSHTVRFELEGVTSGYRPGRTALSDIDLRIDSGTVTVLLGENGAGKSSLLKVLAGILLPRSGAVRLDGGSLQSLAIPERARLIGYLAQGFEPFFPATAFEIALLGRTPRRGRFGSFSAADREAARAALEELDAGDLAGTDILQMSGGERQRVLLARVLAGEGELLLLDEPTANLDPRHRLLLIESLRRRAARGAAVVFSTHELDVALAVADRAVLLRRGKVFKSGPVADTVTGPFLSELFGVSTVVRTGPEGRPWVFMKSSS